MVSAAATATAAASATATFNGGVQDVTLNATITSAAGTVDEGTETFTILNGTTPVGSAVTVNVSAGAASAVYVLPAGTSAGTYIIQAVYNGTTNFLGYTDTSQTLVVSAAATATAAASASVTFSGGAQDVTLNATITSAAGTVNEGTETFTILNGTTPVGSAVTVNVSAGAAGAVYVLPAGTSAGTYIIQAVYNGTTNFLGYTDTSQTLVISAAATATAAASASATFNGGAQDVTLNATITSPPAPSMRALRPSPSSTARPRSVRRSRSTSRRRRQRRLRPACRNSGRDVHHPGGVQRHDELPGLHGYEPDARGRRRGHGHGRRERLGHLQRRRAGCHSERDHHQRRRHRQ